MRPETGSMKFGDDWRGIFFRGDDAQLMCIVLTNLFKMVGRLDDPYLEVERATADHFLQILATANEANPTPTTNIMKQFSDCCQDRDSS